MKNLSITPLCYLIRVLLGIVFAWHTVALADTPSAAISVNPALKPSLPAVVEATETFEQSMSLCDPSEIIVFSCALPKKKIVSLCASKDASNNTGYMQYRFGRDTSSIELEYPQRKAHAKEFFKYYSSSFSKGGTFGISFRIGEYRYSLFSTRSAFGYNGSGVILNRGSDNRRVSFLRCINAPIKAAEILWITPFANSKRIGYFDERLDLPDAGGDISYIGAEPGSDLDQAKPGEPEDWRLRNKH